MDAVCCENNGYGPICYEQEAYPDLCNGITWWSTCWPKDGTAEDCTDTLAPKQTITEKYVFAPSSGSSLLMGTYTEFFDLSNSNKCRPWCVLETTDGTTSSKDIHGPYLEDLTISRPQVIRVNTNVSPHNSMMFVMKCANSGEFDYVTSSPFNI